jgi:hypothetical protein
MNSKPALPSRLAAAALLAAALGWTGLVARPGSSPAGEKESNLPPIVRLDLLAAGERNLAPEKRNIFTGEARSPEAAPAARVPESEPAPDEESGVEETEAGVQYIGYILSPRGIVGLVLVGGTAQAVAPGEGLRPGLTVTRVTRKEIEVQGPGGVKKTYPLQGVDE